MGQLEASKQVKQLIRIEQIRAVYKTIALYFSKKLKSSLMSIKIPDPEDPQKWKQIYQKEEMEQHIRNNSIKHFAQAEGTTPTQTFTRNLIGDGFNPTSDAILQGTFTPPPEMPQLQVEYFKLLKQNPTKKEYHPYMNIEQVKKGFKVWRENTVTSPSGIHLGHYKALLAPDGSNNPSETSEIIWTIIALIINSCIQIGHGITRWERVNQITLEKKPGDNRVHRLRRINQYEADYNLSLKFHWPKQTQTGEDTQGFLGSNQYGGRKNKRSNDVAFINEMIIEFHRLSYGNFSITQHDNTACYDRTIDNITNISNMKHNIPKKMCILTNNIKKK